jgi:two-component system KDP operon response regulator KdpE
MTRVLLVDNNAHLRRLLRGRFVREGFHVIEAADAAAALSEAARSAPDLIVHDASIVDAAGRPFADLLAEDGVLAQVPRIELRARARGGGSRGVAGVACVNHPFRPEQLLRLAHGAVRHPADGGADG